MDYVKLGSTGLEVSEGQRADAPWTQRCGPVPASDHENLENSLRRLGTDYVDLYQIHRWDASARDLRR